MKPCEDLISSQLETTASSICKFQSPAAHHFFHHINFNLYHLGGIFYHDMIKVGDAYLTFLFVRPELYLVNFRLSCSSTCHIHEHKSHLNSMPCVDLSEEKGSKRIQETRSIFPILLEVRPHITAYLDVVILSPRCLISKCSKNIV